MPACVTLGTAAQTMPGKISSVISRRELLAGGAWSLAASGGARAEDGAEDNRSITNVPGIAVGHWTHESGSTGCTAVLSENGAVAGVDVRGGAPGARETELLRPEMSVDKIHAVVLCGGSAFGLAAADGVMRYLEGRGSGYAFGGQVIPIVSAAVLFDLGVGDPKIRPTAESGAAAARAASDAPVAMGNVGAGAGATVGKMLGLRRAMKGGLGSAMLELPQGIVVGALAAVNALGDVRDPEKGTIIAGARHENGSGFIDSMQWLRSGRAFANGAGRNTTIGVVAANVTWTKAAATKAAQMAHDGLARAVRPAHMPADGDTIFALGTGGTAADLRLTGVIGAAAADAFAQAVVAAARAAKGAFGFPAAADIRPGAE